eukprot:297810-Prorocentrum_minimum.AAC.1
MQHLANEVAHTSLRLSHSRYLRSASTARSRAFSASCFFPPTANCLRCVRQNIVNNKKETKEEPSGRDPPPPRAASYTMPRDVINTIRIVA